MCGEVLGAQQEVPATGHTPDSFWTNGAIADKHYKKCLTCGEIAETADHTWNDGKITTEPTTTTEGVKTYTCTACGYTKTETVPKTEEGYVLSYEASSSKGMVIRSNIPTTTGKYKLTFASDNGGFTQSISRRDYATYPLLDIFPGQK